MSLKITVKYGSHFQRPSHTWFDPRLLGICSVVDRCAKLTRSGFIDRPLGDLTARGQPRSDLVVLIEINPIRARVIPVNRTVIPLLLYSIPHIDSGEVKRSLKREFDGRRTIYAQKSSLEKESGVLEFLMT